MLAHALGIVPNFIGALVIFLIATDKPLAKKAAKEALNFQITVGIALFGLVILSLIIGFIPVIGTIIALLLWLVFAGVVIANLVLCIMAAVAVNNGEDYRYPFALRLVK